MTENGHVACCGADVVATQALASQSAWRRGSAHSPSVKLVLRGNTDHAAAGSVVDARSHHNQRRVCGVHGRENCHQRVELKLADSCLPCPGHLLTQKRQRCLRAPQKKRTLENSGECGVIVSMCRRDSEYVVVRA